MHKDDVSCVGCKLKSNAVAVLNENELAILEKGCLKTSFQKGDLVFKESSPAHYIAYIRDGFIKLSKRGVGGKDYILSISKKGAYLGIQNLNKQAKVNYFSASSVTDAEVCFIDIDIFKTLLERNGVFASEVISTIFSDEMNYFERLVNNVQQQLPGRLANTLSYFQKEVYSSSSFSLNLTKAELASLIGTSRESVSRQLKEFQNAKIIKMEKKTISILDESKLEEIVKKG